MHKKSIYISLVSFRIIIFPALVVLFFNSTGIAQCSSTISSFPYTEDFEITNGTWVTGGTSSDWAWGIPSKPVIKNAASGLKCWLTGGLNKTSYNSGENAWLKSPCFNFSVIQHPYIKFDVFWETEGKYDGANLQYSTDNGTTWQLLGGINDAQNCLNGNWFNYGALTNLSNQNAWSGNIQPAGGGCVTGGGSGKWIIAQHTLPSLAGNSSVSFRFVFAAGTTCNNFDGFAVDNFTIGEAPPNVASFTYVCTNSNTISFTNTSSLCPNSFLWNFGDPGSGVNNTSTAANPTHTYALAGSYAVTLTVSGPDNSPSSFIQANISILASVNALVVNPILCNGQQTGSARVNFSGGGSVFDFSWNTIPVQATQTAVNLGAGTYSVTVKGQNGCPATTSVTLTEPPALSESKNVSQPSCNSADGSIAITTSGGAGSYTYSWSPNVSNSNTAVNLPAGTYQISVKDANQCPDTVIIPLVSSSNLAATISAKKDLSCFGTNDGSATVLVNGGTAPYAYSWSPSGGNASVVTNLSPGSYTATVTDNKGCQSIATTFINQPAQLNTTVTTTNTTCGNANGFASVEVQGGTIPYNYLWSPGNSTADSIVNIAGGNYIVTVKDLNGCTIIDTAVIASSTAVNLQLSHTDVLCFSELTGTATALVTGGNSPYNITWTNGTQNFTGSTITALGIGKYNTNVLDVNGCKATGNVIITQPTSINVSLAASPALCSINNGTISAAVTGGIQPFSYLWSPVSDTTAYLNNLSAGTYLLSVTDQNNCTATASATVSNYSSLSISLGADTTICQGDKIILSPGNFNSYTWQDNSFAPAFTVMQQGAYAVKVTDAFGCTATDTIKITADCGEIFFPSGFTPNNDSRNDLFGPLGNLNALKDYSLVIYNRWGQLVFQSNDPFKKWDGKVQSKNPQANTFVWIAKFTYKAQTNIIRKGTVTIVY